MNEKYILTIDVGSQSVRVAIFDELGNIVEIVKSTYVPAYNSPQKGYAEQEPDYYFEQILKCTNKIKNKNPEAMAKVVGVTMDTFRDSAVLLDENYKPLHPVILWMDQRLAEGTASPVPLFNRLIFKIVGMSDTVMLNRKKTIALWYQENMPELWKKVKHYCNISCYLTYKILGKFIDSPAASIGHFPIDFRKRNWYKSNKHFKGRIFGIDNKTLPTLIPVGEVMGYINEEFSSLSGLPVGVPFYSCASDKSCESLGCGAVNPDIASISYGTAASIEVTVPKYYESEPFLPSYPAAVKGCYNMDVQIYRGYWMLNWFARQFSNTYVVDSTTEIACIKEFNDRIKTIPAGCDGLVLQPYWQPGLSRPLAKGAVVGWSDVHTKEHLYRAIIEGIAFSLREALEHFQSKIKKKIKEIFISGGGSQSDVICQITSDIFGLPVNRVQTFETSSLGAAIVGFTSAGIYKNEIDAVNKMVRKSVTFLPNMEEHKKYNELFYNVYLKMFPKLKKIYRSIRNFAKK